MQSDVFCKRATKFECFFVLWKNYRSGSLMFQIRLVSHKGLSEWFTDTDATRHNVLLMIREH